MGFSIEAYVFQAAKKVCGWISLFTRTNFWIAVRNFCPERIPGNFFEETMDRNGREEQDFCWVCWCIHCSKQIYRRNIYKYTDKLSREAERARLRTLFRLLDEAPGKVAWNSSRRYLRPKVRDLDSSLPSAFYLILHSLLLIVAKALLFSRRLFTYVQSLALFVFSPSFSLVRALHCSGCSRKAFPVRPSGDLLAFFRILSFPP